MSLFDEMTKKKKQYDKEQKALADSIVKGTYKQRDTKQVKQTSSPLLKGSDAKWYNENFNKREYQKYDLDTTLDNAPISKEAKDRIYSSYGIENDSSKSVAKKLSNIKNGDYKYYEGGKTGTKDGAISIKEANALRKYINEQNAKKQQEEINNRTVDDWKQLRNLSDVELKEQQRNTNQLLKDRGLNARVTGTKIQSDVAPSRNDVKVGDKFENNLQKDANNNIAVMDFIKTDEGRKQLKNLRQKWDERAYNISGYETKKAQEDERNQSVLSKVAMTPIRGGASVFSGLRGDLATENGQLSSYNDAFLQAQSENAKTGIGRLGYNALSEVGKQTVAQALNYILPGAGTASYFTDIANDQYNNAINMGYSDKAALNYALLSTGTEAIFERFLGAGSNYFGGKMGAENVISGTLSNFIKNKTTNDLLSAFISEGSEEFLEEYLGEFNKQLTLDWADKGQDIDYSKIFNAETTKNAFESFLIGGITGTIGATNQRISTPKDLANYNQAVYSIERKNGKLSQANKQILNNMVAISELTGKPLNAKQIVDNFNNAKNAQISNFQKSALDLFPNLDEQSRNEYNKLINDASELIYDTGMNITFDPNLDVVSEIEGNNITINPTMTDMPIKTLLLKELGTQLVDNKTKQYILSSMKKNGSYDTLKQQLLDSGEFDEANVDNEIISIELNRIFDNQEELNKLVQNNKGAIENIKSLVDNLVSKITNDRTTKDAQYLRELGAKLNISNDLLNNKLSGEELSNRETENIERIESEENTKNNVENKVEEKQTAKERKTFESAYFKDGKFIKASIDFGEKEAKEALKTGKVRVFYTGDLKNGTNVTTSPVKAVKDANGNMDIVNEATVKLDEINWKDGGLEGQYDKVDTKKQDKSENTTTKEGKKRKAYETMQKSDNIPKEDKKIAKKLEEEDTYIPDSNEAQLQRADEVIKRDGIEKAYNSLKYAVETNKKIDQDDIALAERALQYYRENGTKEQKEDAIMTTAMAGTIAGRTLQAMKLIYKMSPEGQVAWVQKSVDKLNKEILKNNKNSKQQFTFTDEMKQAILDSTKENRDEVIDKVYKELGNQVTMNALQKLDTWRYFAMLSSPTTHFRNILGNFTMGKMQSVKNKIKGGIEDVYYGVTGREGERTATLRKTKKEYIEYAKNDIKNVGKQLGIDENKYKESTNQITDNIRMFKSDFLEKWVKKGVINRVEKALNKEDVWGLKAAYTKAMSQYLNANRINLKEITNQQLAKARAYAIDEAKRATFHQDNAIASAINTIENQNLFTKVAVGGLIPFKKTPLNVTATSLRYNPIGLLESLTRGTARLYKGQITANQYIDNISQGLTGTAIAVLGYAMASAGWIRTTGDDDEDYYEDKGVQPYSIVLGDKTISLDWLSPSAVPLFVGAELFNQMKIDLENTDVDKRQEKFISLMGAVEAGVSSLNPVSEMTMLSGIQNALKSYDKNYAKAFSQIGSNIVKNYVSQIVPSVYGKAVRISDDYERSTTSTKTGVVDKAVDQFWNQIKSKSFILRKTLPTKTDVWGNDIKQEENFGAKLLLNFASPAIVKDVRHTKLDDEIERLYKSTGEKNVMPRTYIDKKLTYNDKDYQLTNSEYALYKKTLGQMNYKNLNELINSSEYKKLNDTQKAEIMKKIYSFDKDGVIKVAYAKAKNINYEDTIYKTPKEVVSLGGDVVDYYLYNSTLDGKETEYEKKEKLKNFNISDKSKSAIYESGTSKSTNDLYQVLKESNVNINDYLDYLSKEFKGDKDKHGTTIRNSSANKKIDYMNNSNLTYEQKLLILSREFTLPGEQKDYVIYRILDSNLNKDQKLELLKSVKGVNVDDDGNVRW